jgi:hypothetical protein
MEEALARDYRSLMVPIKKIDKVIGFYFYSSEKLLMIEELHCW